MPTSVSFSVRASLSISSLPSSALSSAPSTALKTAPFPPAMTACTVSGETEYVGGHSEASSMPRRPEVPQPQYIRRPPRFMRAYMRSMAAAICGQTFSTASATFLSSLLMRLTISAVVRRSISRLRGLRRSVASFVISEVSIDIFPFSQPFTAPIVTPSRKYF